MEYSHGSMVTKAARQIICCKLGVPANSSHFLNCKSFYRLGDQTCEHTFTHIHTHVHTHTHTHTHTHSHSAAEKEEQQRKERSNSKKQSRAPGASKSGKKKHKLNSGNAGKCVHLFGGEEREDIFVCVCLFVCVCVFVCAHNKLTWLELSCSCVLGLIMPSLGTHSRVC